MRLVHWGLVLPGAAPLLHLLFFICWLLPGSAEANMAAPRHQPSVVSGPRTASRTPLVIDRERLEIRCVESSDGEPVCSFEASYVVRNPTPATVALTPGFLSARTRRVELFVDGVRVDRELNEAEVQALLPGNERRSRSAHGEDPSEQAAEPGSGAQAPEFSSEEAHWLELASQAPSVRGVDLQLDPGATRVLVAKGELVPGELWEPEGYALPAGTARHPLLRPEIRTGVYEIDYLISPIRTWAAVGPIDVQIRTPAAWHAKAAAPVAQQRSVRAGVEEISFRLRAEQLPRLGVTFEIPRSQFHPGGPLLGIGGTFGEAGGFRVRLGWEVAAPQWVLYSVTADTDFDDRLVLTPLVEVASPWLLVIPSMGIGLGAPVRTLPETHVGARIQLSAALGPLAWVTSFDWFPGVAASRADDKQVTMLFVVSL